MPARECEAFVLRTYPYRETDLIVSFVARDQGKLRGIANRARRPKNRFGSGLERLSHVQLSYFQRHDRDLVRVDGCELMGPPIFLRADYATSVALDYVAEICDRLLPEHEPNDKFFRLVALVLEQIWSKLDSRRLTSAGFAGSADGGAASGKTDSAETDSAENERSSPSPASNGSQEAAQGWLWLVVTYFSLWAVKLGGWMPPLNVCIQSGAELGPRETAYFERSQPGLFSADFRTRDCWAMSPESRAMANQMLKTSLRDMDSNPWVKQTAEDLRRFLTQRLEAQLEARLKTVGALDEL